MNRAENSPLSAHGPYDDDDGGLHQQMTDNNIDDDDRKSVDDNSDDDDVGDLSTTRRSMNLLDVISQIPIGGSETFPDVIELNVGGQVFATSLTTLHNRPDSMLSSMFSGKYKLTRDSQGRYFIDRDGTLFRHILNYMRCGIMPPKEKALDVYLEAEFYGLWELAEKLEGSSPQVIEQRRKEIFRRIVIRSAKDWRTPGGHRLQTRSSTDHHSATSIGPPSDHVSASSAAAAAAISNKTSYDDFLDYVIQFARKSLVQAGQSRVIIGEKGHPCLTGQVICYNCAREHVDVTHRCTFDGMSTQIELASKSTIATKQQNYHSTGGNQAPHVVVDERHHHHHAFLLDSAETVGRIQFIVSDLRELGFDASYRTLVCGYSVRCSACTQSGLYTAGGILAPKQCPNVGYVLTFNWERIYF